MGDESGQEKNGDEGEGWCERAYQEGAGDESDIVGWKRGPNSTLDEE